MKKKYYKLIKDSNLLLRTQGKNVRVLWYPKITNEMDLIREICRAVWYLAPITKSLSKLIFHVSDEFYNYNYKGIQIPEYLDPSIKIFINNFENICFESNRSKLQNQYDIQLFWKDSKKNNYKKSSKFYPYSINADFYENQFESIQLMKLSNLFITKQDKVNNSKLKDILTNIKSNKKDVLLIGSGPSTASFKSLNINYDNTISMICNSVVKNVQLLDQLRPEIIVASDSVFHSGYSKYAAEFRKALVYAMEYLPQTILIVPLRDYKIYINFLPKSLSSRLFAIQSQRDISINIDLIKRLKVRSTSNILTLFMLPVAATISKNIKLIGFDGKSNDEGDIFWKYDQNSQFNCSYESTKKAHPAFYKVDYDEYYNRHCYEAEKLISKLKGKNYIINNLSNSNISALKEVT